MQFDYLKEFVVYAQHLSITNASKELHMSQSTLSKHIKLLEEEVQCPLLRYHNAKTYLTKAGTHYFNFAQKLLAEFDQLAAECRALGTSAELPEITILDSPYTDNASELYNHCIERLQQEYPQLQLRYVKSSHKALLEELLNKRIDIAIDYHFGDLDKIKASYHKRGLSVSYLCSDDFVIWCKREHRLNKADRLLPEDLRDVPIMIPCDIQAPMYSAIVAFCSQYGLDPIFTAVASGSQQEFLSQCLPNSIYFYPSSFMETPLIKAYNTMATVRFSSDDIIIHAFMVTRLNSENSNSIDYKSFLTSVCAES